MSLSLLFLGAVAARGGVVVAAIGGAAFFESQNMGLGLGMVVVLLLLLAGFAPSLPKALVQTLFCNGRSYMSGSIEYSR
jgi:hypothetical protein